MNDNLDPQLNKAILEKIKTGQVTMHSKTYWVWRAVLLVLGTALAAAVGIFLLSFILFMLRTTGNWDLPQFGLHGLWEFLAVFPWLFIPALLLFLWLLERFVLQYTFVYRLPVIYSAGIVLVIIVVASFVVLATPFHRRLFESARRQGLPVAGGMYRFFGHSRPDDFFVGKVMSNTAENFLITTPEGQQVVVMPTTATRWLTPPPVNNGDCVEIVGEEKQQKITAYVIKKSDGQMIITCGGVDMSLPY